MPKNRKLVLSSVYFLFLLFLIISSCSKSGPDTAIIRPPDTTIVTPPAIPVDTPVNTKKWIVSTFAGSGDKGKADGDSTEASFYSPSSLTIDQQGNLFVSDQLNFNIRKITTSRHVSTYAGQDVSSPNPLWGNISSLVLDKLGNLYDVEYAMVRKIASPTDNFIFAGGLTEDYKDGVGTEAEFHVINHITVDKDNNLYLPDYDRAGNSIVRKVTPTAVVTTLALQDNTGYPDIDGPDHYYIFSIAADRNGNIYKTGNGSTLIKKITPDGNVTVLTGATGTSAHFSAIMDMVTDSIGNLYVVDIVGSTVRKVTPDGQVTTIAGTGEQGYADGEGSEAKFNYPAGITISKEGVIYVADQANNRIRKIEYK